ncbi:MAG TPA: Zn-ribbon domain-containing OB-fold protein [Steroidobacteraceae bacterium]|nr:Zn-ribbon domain-containing OB-fold protein [Steroidobacteraceae bacterium]
MSELERPAATRPDPVFTPDAVFFWEGAARGELLGQRCADCHKLVFPPRPMCPACHSVKREVVRLSGRGEVYSWIMPRHPPPVGFADAPIVALIELEEGTRFVSNLVDIGFSEVRAGLPVEVTFVPTRGGKAVPVFRPRRGRARD